MNKIYFNFKREGCNGLPRGPSTEISTSHIFFKAIKYIRIRAQPFSQQILLWRVDCLPPESTAIISAFPYLHHYLP